MIKKVLNPRARRVVLNWVLVTRLRQLVSANLKSISGVNSE